MFHRGNSIAPAPRAIRPFLVNAAMVNGGGFEFLGASKNTANCVCAYELCILKRG